MNMDMWKFYDITHRHHVICNPTSEDKLGRLVDLAKLPAGARVVDIACGKAEFLIRLAESHGVSGVGVDLSPFFVAEAKERLRTRALDSSIEIVEMDGAKFRPDEQNGFALVSCLGASWVFGGHGGTLDALAGMVAPGGWVIAGEPYWLQEPSEEYVQASGLPRESVGSHEGNAAAGKQRGLELVHTLVSSRDDWDVYEGLQWYATAEYGRNHPDDPDVPELVQKVEKERDVYLRWGRDTVGWSIYLFRQRVA
jgi:SAM-dependent methyltransferase